MPTQTATTGQLEDAQRIAIAKAKFTAESAAPCKNLIQRFTLKNGEKSLTVPKVGQMEAANLTDGVDLVDSEAIGMTTTSLTTGEVGLKVILTDKLVRQENEDVFTMVGKQMGDACARKVDQDIIALFTGFSKTLGADGASLALFSASACVNIAHANMYPEPISFVHHPMAIGDLGRQAAALGTTYYAGILGSLSEEMLRNFWKINVGGCNFYWDANITKITGYDSAYGAIFSQEAMAYIESQGWKTERERDASLRATEVVVTSDYGVFELDDAYGASCRYEIGDDITT